MVLRLKSGFWVRALLRRINGDGTSAMLLHRGDEDAGAVLVVLLDRSGAQVVLREDGSSWSRACTGEKEDIEHYIQRQRRYDPDLWVLEISVDHCHDAFETSLGTRNAPAEDPYNPF